MTDHSKRPFDHSSESLPELPFEQREASAADQTAAEPTDIAPNFKRRDLNNYVVPPSGLTADLIEMAHQTAGINSVTRDMTIPLIRGASERNDPSVKIFEIVRELSEDLNTKSVLKKYGISEVELKSALLFISELLRMLTVLNTFPANTINPSRKMLDEEIRTVFHRIWSSQTDTSRAAKKDWHLLTELLADRGFNF